MHALAALCVKRPVFATMLIVALMVVGIFSFFTLGVDLFPKIDLPTIIVTVANPGASAEEIETDITKRIEDAVNTTSGIDAMQSTSIEGNSTVVINFTLDKSGDVAAQEVRDKVNPSCKWSFRHRGRCAKSLKSPTSGSSRCSKTSPAWARLP
jgi:HAE1 family hydrophobic/amphiphilic exporter-1